MPGRRVDVEPHCRRRASRTLPAILKQGTAFQPKPIDSRLLRQLGVFVQGEVLARFQRSLQHIRQSRGIKLQIVFVDEPPLRISAIRTHQAGMFRIVEQQTESVEAQPLPCQFDHPSVEIVKTINLRQFNSDLIKRFEAS